MKNVSVVAAQNTSDSNITLVDDATKVRDILEFLHFVDYYDDGDAMPRDAAMGLKSILLYCSDTLTGAINNRGTRNS